MASGDASAGSSGLRLGGYTLIGVGMLAGVFGVATSVADNSQNVGQQSPPPPPPASSQPVESSPNEESATSAPSETDKPSEDKPGDGKPDDGQSGDDKPGGDKPSADRPGSKQPDTPGDGKQDNRISIRVYNNSKIKGLADRAAEDFRAAGYQVAEVGNYSAGRIYTTTVYFRPGTPEKAKAAKLADDFDARLEPRFHGLDQASPGVIAVITNDYVGLGGGKGSSGGKGG